MSGTHDGTRAQPWPLLGRARELAEANRALGDPHRAGVLVTGPFGTGRSRLARECWSEAGRRGHPCLEAAATPAARSIPLGALAPVLGPGPDGTPGLSAPLAPGPGRPRPVLFLDDAPHLDDASARMLAALMHEGRVSLVVTAEPQGPLPWREHGLLPVRLQPLPLDVVDQLLRHALGGAVERRTVRLFRQASGGRPRELEEVLDGALRRGVLAHDGLVWRLTGPLTATSRLRALVESRLRRLSARHAEFLERVSVCGRLTLDPARHADLGRLAEEGWVRLVPSGPYTQVELCSALHGEVLRSRLPSQRVRRILREEAARSRHLRTHPGVLLDIVRWRADAAEPLDEADVEDAVAVARRTPDHDTALRLARELPRLRPGPHSVLTLAEQLFERGHCQEAEAALERAARDATSPADRVAATALHVQHLAVGRMSAAEALSAAAEARRACPGAPETAVLDAVESALRCRMGDITGALRVLTGMPAHAPGPAHHLAQLARSHCLRESGLTAAAAHLARRPWPGPPTPGTDTLAHPALLIGAQARALAESGALRAAGRLAEHGYDRAVDAGALRAQTWLAEHLGWTYYLQGRLDESRIWYASALAHAREAGLRSGAWAGTCGLALVAAVRADVAEAERRWREAQELGDGAWWRPEQALAGAWLAAATGRIAEARQRLREAAEDAARRGMRTSQSHLWCDVARLGGAREAVAPLARLAASSDSALTGARADFARTTASDDGTAMEACAAGLERLGARLLAAEAWNAATAAHLRTPAPDAARRTRGRVCDLTGPAGSAARTPGLVDPDARALLTGRELQVALAATAGLTQEETARQLSLAVRTVVNHLHRVRAKLGVRDVRGMRAVLYPGPAPAAPARTRAGQ
ncbi:LuxR C-terminal-related transcriptional regulator [Streptomyces collinus]|uniref:LuxR C-terminal-related transcriptional regulator n=1 Tax=Streptomyces collinus TaxID=42684 RepID=UPI003689993C